MNNPFQTTSPLNHELSVEQCQRIFFTAARSAPLHSVDPQRVLDALRTLAHYYGPEVYLLHPHDIEQMFRGTTLAVYQAVRHLFCTSLFRNDRTVWQILEAWACDATTAAPTSEAVWAICEYLRAERDEQFTPRIDQSSARWYIGMIQPDAIIQGQRNAFIKPTFVCVVSNEPEQVLAFRRYEADTPPNEVITETLYEALTDQRHPEQLAASGLTWRVPAGIDSAIPLPPDVQSCCAALNLPIEVARSAPALMRDLHGSWTRSLAGRTISAKWFEAIFDNYLEKRHGYGPRKAHDDAEYAYRHLEGYNRDPALIIPALRYLLPLEQATVSDDGTLTIARRLYHDPLLTRWGEHPVDVRVSRHDPAQIYVYLNSGILCQAQEAVNIEKAEAPDLPADC